MKKTLAIKGGTALTLLVLGWLGILGVSAQPPRQPSGTSVVTTNWIGYLVVGGDAAAGPFAPGDPMPGLGPVPTTVRQVQVGLRSDGAVIWREAPHPK